MTDTAIVADLNRRIIPPFLVPGAAYYVTGEDRLRVAIANTLAGLTGSIRGRFCQLNGTITPFVVDVTPASDGSTGNTDIILGEGWLLNVEFLVTAGTPTSAQTFVSMLLVRGDSAAAFEIATIGQGFATAINRVFWPWSQQVTSAAVTRDTIPKIISPADPAAGAQISVAVPATKGWRLLGIAAKLTNSAAVANRDVCLQITDAGGVILWNQGAVVDQTASQAKSYAWANSVLNETGYSSVLNTIRLPLANLWLPAGALITTVTSNFQAGDQWSNTRLVVEETSGL